MAKMRIGSMNVHRVEEKGRVLAIPLAAFMPETPAEEALRLHSWLAPHHLDVDSQRVLSTFQSWVIRTKRHVVVVDTCCGK